MNVILLGGFLGSGKTTLLLQLAPFLAKGSENPSAVVILENELAATDVDTKMLKSLGLEVRNLSAGCICCTSSASLPDSIRQVEAQFHPDHLIIEATGMAYPDTVARLAEETTGRPVKVCILADASRWEKFSRAMPQFAQCQLDRADIILLNKIDRIGEETKRRLLESIGTCGKAPVYPVSLKERLDEGILIKIRS